VQEPTRSRARRAGKRLAKWWHNQIVLDSDEVLAEVQVIQAWRRQHAQPLALTTPVLRRWIGKETTVRPIPVAQRMKQLMTIVDKLVRHPTMNLDRMQDIAGARGILPDHAAIDRVASKVHRYWEVVGDDDYRERGRPVTGYRARHLIVLRRDRRVEIQLRTAEQHRWAEIVAATGERLGYALKDGGGPADLLEYFRMASDMLWLVEQGQQPSAIQRKAFVEIRETVRPYFAPRT
jgi:ppGpp synthetase/RelA/SpoT-type nucleotidyltranferase